MKQTLRNQVSIANIHVVYRESSNYALVIRKGPSGVVGFFGLDLKTDILTEGQWLKGRIYENKCDISPDGKYVIYFASKGKATKDTSGTWTAVSRFPFMAAIDLWDNGTTYGGGGLFSDNNHYVLNTTYLPKPIRKDSKFVVSHETLTNTKHWKTANELYFKRLIRSGWTFNEELMEFEKPINKNLIIKKKILWNKNHIQNEENYVVLLGTSEILLTSSGNWMEMIGACLYWCEKGIINKARIKSRIIEEVNLIADLNQYKYKEIVAKQ